jgi:hypothetical protein
MTEGPRRFQHYSAELNLANEKVDQRKNETLEEISELISEYRDLIIRRNRVLKSLMAISLKSKMLLTEKSNKTLTRY